MTSNSKLKSGDIIEITDPVECIAKGDVRRVFEGEQGHLFVHCSQGKHYLNEDEDDPIKVRYKRFSIR